MFSPPSPGAEGPGTPGTPRRVSFRLDSPGGAPRPGANFGSAVPAAVPVTAAELPRRAHDFQMNWFVKKREKIMGPRAILFGFYSVYVSVWKRSPKEGVVIFPRGGVLVI